MLGLRINADRIEAKRRFGLAQAVAAAFDGESMLALAEAAGVNKGQIARARLDLIHEEARERAKQRFGV